MSEIPLSDSYSSDMCADCGDDVKVSVADIDSLRGLNAETVHQCVHHCGVRLIGKMSERFFRADNDIEIFIEAGTFKSL